MKKETQISAFSFIASIFSDLSIHNFSALKVHTYISKTHPTLQRHKSIQRGGEILQTTIDRKTLRVTNRAPTIFKVNLLQQSLCA